MKLFSILTILLTLSTANAGFDGVFILNEKPKTEKQGDCDDGYRLILKDVEHLREIAFPIPEIIGRCEVYVEGDDQILNLKRSKKKACGAQTYEARTSYGLVVSDNFVSRVTVHEVTDYRGHECPEAQGSQITYEITEYNGSPMMLEEKIHHDKYWSFKEESPEELERDVDSPDDFLPPPPSAELSNTESSSSADV